MSYSEIPWTKESLARAKGFWDAGFSAAEIGRRVHKTKNAVLGKAHRMGWAARAAPCPARGSSICEPFDAQIREMASNGYGCALIGRQLQMNQTTVASYMARRGIKIDGVEAAERRAGRYRKHSRFTPAGTVKRPRVIAPKRVAPHKSQRQEPRMPPMSKPPGAGTTGPAGCRMPLWEHAARPTGVFCGDPCVPGRSWCSYCCGVVFTIHHHAAEAA